MKKYAALLRGIGPGNPNMRNEKLREVFLKLGFKNVQTVISSGNVLFESPSKNRGALEKKIEKAIPAQLGFTSNTIIRTREELQKLIDEHPFKKFEHNPKTYLTVTFFRSKPKKKYKFPYRPDNKPYRLVGMYDLAICAITDLTGVTPDLMTWLEKEFGKEITTRTWKTVHRIVKKLG